MTSNFIHRIRNSEPGVTCQLRLTKRWNRPVEVEDWIPMSQNHQITGANNAKDRLQISMSVAQIVESKVIFCRKSIKFWKTALISVNSHISANQWMQKHRLFGRHLVNCRHTLNLIALSLAATFATDPNSNTWQEFSCKNIFETNVQKFWLCVKFATKNMLELTLQVTNVLRTSILKNLSKMSTTSSKTLLTNWFFTEDRKKASDCAPNISVLKNIGTILINTKKAWLHKTLKIVPSSVSDVKLLSRPTKIATSAFTAMKHIALHVLATASSTIWKKWSSFFLSEDEKSLR